MTKPIRRAIVHQAQSTALDYAEQGVIWWRKGDHQKAIQALSYAIQLAPTNDGYMVALGKAFRTAGDTAHAQDCFERSVRLNPRNSIGHNLLGRLHFEVFGDVDRAIECFRNAVASAPQMNDGYRRLCVCLIAQFKLYDAVQWLKREFPERKQFALALLGLQFAYSRRGSYADATACNEDFIRQYPPGGPALQNLGTIALALRDVDLGMEYYRAAIRAEPENFEHRVCYIKGWLRMGDYERAREEFQSSKHLLPPCRFANPSWNGEPLSRKTIVVNMSAGFGDAIQFVRFTSHLAEEGASVILRCPSRLHELMSSVSWVTGVTNIEEGAPAADFECHCDNILFFRPVEVRHFASNIPYLVPSAAARFTARSLLHHGKRKRRVGLQFRGRDCQEVNPYQSRSLRSADRVQLPEATDTELFSLEFESNNVKERSLPNTNLPEPIGAGATFMELAGIIKALDVIVSVDTATAHLAGALGKPTLLLLPYSPIDGWRWSQDGPGTPWYSTFQLFRQKDPGEWRDPLMRAWNTMLKMTADYSSVK